MPSEPMRCSHCAAPVSAGDVRCAACGHTLHTSRLGPPESALVPKLLTASAALVGLFGFGLAALVAVAAQNVFESVLAALIALSTLVVVAAAVWLSRRARAGARERRRAAMERALAELVSTRRGVVTAKEVAEHLGLPVADADAMLDALVRQGKADMDVTDGGKIEFKFAEPPRPGSVAQALAARRVESTGR